MRFGSNGFGNVHPQFPTLFSSMIQVEATSSLKWALDKEIRSPLISSFCVGKFYLVFVRRHKIVVILQDWNWQNTSLGSVISSCRRQDVFFKADLTSCSTLKSILHKYEQASRQLINAGKSSISFSAQKPQETHLSVKQSLGIAKEDRVGKYMDLPELFSKKNRELFSSILKRIKQRAASWSSRQLSPASKLTEGN